MKVLTVICGGSLNLEILRGGRAQAVLEIQLEVGGGSKNRAFRWGRGGVEIFSGITYLYEMSIHK